MSRRGFEDLGRLEAAVFALAVCYRMGVEYISKTRRSPGKDSEYLEALEQSLSGLEEPSHADILGLGRELQSEGMGSVRGTVGQALVNAFDR